MMETEEKKTKIKKIIEEILEKLTLDAMVEVLEAAEGLRFILKTPEGELFIGENGKNLISLNHLVKRIFCRDEDVTKEDLNFFLDVNDYQEKKIEELKNLARLNAQRVRYFKKEIALRAMNSFERRVIHSSLADYPDIITSSEGKEPERQVVIRPYL